MKITREAPRETELVSNDPSVVLSSRRTALSFERTRMGADRTLMAIVRTSLSLIGFGFTIHAVFDSLKEAGTVPLNEHAARNFALALISVGVVLLVMGLAGHRKFQESLTEQRADLFEQKLITRSYSYRATPTFIAAGALLLIGLAAILTIVFNLM